MDEIKKTLLELVETALAEAESGPHIATSELAMEYGTSGQTRGDILRQYRNRVKK